jgi:hypothetical protein
MLLEEFGTLNLLFSFPDESAKELISRENQSVWSLGTCKRTGLVNRVKVIVIWQLAGRFRVRTLSQSAAE